MYLLPSVVTQNKFKMKQEPHKTRLNRKEPYCKVLFFSSNWQTQRQGLKPNTKGSTDGLKLVQETGETRTAVAKRNPLAAGVAKASVTSPWEGPGAAGRQHRCSTHE